MPSNTTTGLDCVLLVGLASSYMYVGRHRPTQPVERGGTELQQRQDGDASRKREEYVVGGQLCSAHVALLCLSAVPFQVMVFRSWSMAAFPPHRPSHTSNLPDLLASRIKFQVPTASARQLSSLHNIKPVHTHSLSLISPPLRPSSLFAIDITYLPLHTHQTSCHARCHRNRNHAPQTRPPRLLGERDRSRDRRAHARGGENGRRVRKERTRAGGAGKAAREGGVGEEGAAQGTTSAAGQRRRRRPG
ncbi:hypothetical protein IWZ00DRAFT_571607 [Phyllosticta capitalensis]